MALSSALVELASIERPQSQLNANRLRATLVDAGDISNLERRQMQLVNLYLMFVRMPNEKFMAMDIGIHVAVLESLIRYEIAWLTLARQRDLGYWSSIDSEHVYCALGTVLDTVSLAYNITNTTTPSRASLHSVLIAMASTASVVPSKRVRDMARCVRIMILQRFQFSLSDAMFLARVTNDNQLTVVAESSVAFVDLLVVGLPRIEQSLGRLGSLTAQSLESVGRNSGGLSIPSTIDADMAALAFPLWIVLVVVSCVRTVNIIRNAIEASDADRRQFTNVVKSLFGSTAADFVERHGSTGV
jgi:hypothetical protein